MNYSEAIAFLSSLQMFGARPGLERVQELSARLNHPERSLRFIHVAGTNGKGSICAMLESIHRQAGRRVGLYTSPHLVSFRERIQINRQLMAEADVARLVTALRPALEDFAPDNHPTFFEAVTVLALQHFAGQGCDLVIWETGLGGRLDATNIVTPLASVITNVQMDHEKWLGSTLPEIAREKAGIIKPGVPVITAATGAALEVIRGVAEAQRAPLHVVEAPAHRPELGLRGPHQSWNAAAALRTVAVLEDRLPTTPEQIRRGLATVSWAARFQVVSRGRQTVVLDGAHNPDGARALAETLQREFPGRAYGLVLGILEDKCWETVCRTLAAGAERIILTRVASQRTADPAVLVPVCLAANPNASVQAVENLQTALQQAGTDGLLVVAGSLYLMGEAMELLGLGIAAQERSLNEWSGPGPSSHGPIRP